MRIMNLLEDHKRGGLTFVGSKREANANNEYMPDYDPNKKIVILFIQTQITSMAEQ